MNFQDLITKFENILSNAQKERKNKQKYDEIIGEPEWVIFERKTMTDAINEERNLLNKEHIDGNEVLKAENYACGHCDYSHKFSLYCAELVNKDKFAGK